MDLHIMSIILKRIIWMYYYIQNILNHSTYIIHNLQERKDLLLMARCQISLYQTYFQRIYYYFLFIYWFVCLFYPCITITFLNVGANNYVFILKQNDLISLAY